MESTLLSQVINQVRRAVLLPDRARMSDGQLLEYYRKEENQSRRREAFAAVSSLRAAAVDPALAVSSAAAQKLY